MSDDDRLVSGKAQRDDRENIALRPKLLRDIVGQDRVRENLKIIIDAAKALQAERKRGNAQMSDRMVA